MTVRMVKNENSNCPGICAFFSFKQTEELTEAKK